MNARRRLQREIIRRRQRHWAPWAPVMFTRFVTPSGIHVRASISICRCALHTMHATYRTRSGAVYAAWPPTPELIRELGP